MKKRYTVAAFLLLSLALVFVACQSQQVTSAKVYIQQDNWDKAMEQLEEAVRLYPTDSEAWFLLGQGHSMKSEWAEMVKALDNSLANNPTPQIEAQAKNLKDKSWANTFNSGVKKFNGDDLEKAVDLFGQCIVIDSTRFESYKVLGMASLRQDNKDAAKANFVKTLTLKLDTTQVDIVHALAGIYFEEQDYDNVVKWESKVLEIDPTNGDALANMALAYDSQGQSEKAVDLYKKALESNPDDTVLLFNLGNQYYKNNEYEKALGLFEKVIEKDPTDYNSNLLVGNAYLNMAEDFKKSLAETYEDKGEAVPSEKMDEMKGLYGKAIKYMEAALEAKSDNANLWNNLGVCYVNVGNAEKGTECFKKAEELE